MALHPILFRLCPLAPPPLYLPLYGLATSQVSTCKAGSCIGEEALLYPYTWAWTARVRRRGRGDGEGDVFVAD
jgi:hypothetical protein